MLNFFNYYAFFPNWISTFFVIFRKSAVFSFQLFASYYSCMQAKSNRSRTNVYLLKTGAIIF